MYVMGLLSINLIVCVWVFGAIIAARLTRPPINIHEDGFGFLMLIFAWPLVLIFDCIERLVKRKAP